MRRPRPSWVTGVGLFLNRRARHRGSGRSPCRAPPRPRGVAPAARRRTPPGTSVRKGGTGEPQPVNDFVGDLRQRRRARRDGRASGLAVADRRGLDWDTCSLASCDASYTECRTGSQAIDGFRSINDAQCMASLGGPDDGLDTVFSMDAGFSGVCSSSAARGSGCLEPRPWPVGRRRNAGCPLPASSSTFVN